jgi:hypothetical protein
MKPAVSSLAPLALSLVALAAWGDGQSKPEGAAKDPAASATASAAATAAPTSSAAEAPSAAPTAEPSAVADAAGPASGAPAASAAPAATAAAQPGATATVAKAASAAPAETAAPAAAPTGPVAGKPWQISTAVQADPGYKCNDEYPHKFTTKGGTNVTYPDPKPRGQCAGKGVSVTIPFVPTGAGPGTIVGTFSYGICDEAKTSCLMKKQEVSLPFVAAAGP